MSNSSLNEFKKYILDTNPSFEQEISMFIKNG